MTILLDEGNPIHQVRLHIVEFRGFEVFTQGRRRSASATHSDESKKLQQLVAPDRPGDHNAPGGRCRRKAAVRDGGPEMLPFEISRRKSVTRRRTMTADAELRFERNSADPPHSFPARRILLVVVGRRSAPLRFSISWAGKRNFVGKRLAGDFRRRMRENGRNSFRRARIVSLTDRNCEGFSPPGNRVGLPGLPGGAERIQTDGHRDLTPSGRGMCKISAAVVLVTQAFNTTRSISLSLSLRVRISAVRRRRSDEKTQ